MLVGDLTDDRESESCAVTLGALNAEKSLEDAFVRPLRNAGTGVLDAEKSIGRADSAAHRGRAAPRCVAKRVVDQIVQRLGQQDRIAPNRRVRQIEAEDDIPRDGPW